MTAKVFIDGHAGTIGLRIRELLAPRRDLTIVEIPESRRKEPAARREYLNACDVAILCLPDEASVEAVAWIENPKVRVIDGSTAFRVHPDWAYGLPELGGDQRRAIASAQRVSNPGCWPTCVALLTRPLMQAGLLSGRTAFSLHGISGYSGAGKAGIERWESESLRTLPYPAVYALDKRHKHIPEMMKYGLIQVEPQFVPSVGAFARGMRVEIPLHTSQLPSGVTAERILGAYQDAYAREGFVRVAAPSTVDEFTLDPRACNGTNRVDIRVIQHASGHVLLVAMLDNLGKGASGAAVQSLNLMLGFAEDTGLSA
jgi:N-acetyl-gamma-glutamyl-phosphate reductase